MAFIDLQFRRLLIFVSLLMLSSATDGHNNNTSTPGIHEDVFNRTVTLNRASEHYLAMIFHEYSDNSTEKISAVRFKDLLRDLNLGEKVSVTKSSVQPSHTAESSESSYRHARSFDEQASEFARGLSGQRSRQKRRSKEQSNKNQEKSQVNLSEGRPARSRDRKRRNIEDQHSHDDHEEVRSVFILTF